MGQKKKEREKEILYLIHSVSFGDTLAATPTLRRLYYAYGSRINVVTRNAKVFKGNPYINRLLSFTEYDNLVLDNSDYEVFESFTSAGKKDESNANFDFIESPYSNYQFPSQNVAVFSENVFQLSPKWSITPGIRFEYIITKSEGAYNVSYFDLAGNTLFDTLIADHRNSERSFVISGVGTSYKFKKHELYANISQNYRAINFNDMRVNNPNLKVNPDLQDEKGFSADFGLRGKLSSFFIYDLSLYYLKYIGRIGTIAQVDQNTFRIYRYRTNVSDSRNIGLESYAELDILGLLSKGESKSRLSLFTNFTLQDARYINSEEPAYQNKKVENAPNVILFIVFIFHTFL